LVFFLFWYKIIKKKSNKSSYNNPCPRILFKISLPFYLSDFFVFLSFHSYQKKEKQKHPHQKKIICHSSL